VFLFGSSLKELVKIPAHRAGLPGSEGVKGLVKSFENKNVNM
jgi:hypothetical protein